MAITNPQMHPEFNSKNFHIARNAATSVYGHAEEHKIGVYVRFGDAMGTGRSVSTAEARAAGRALINLADKIEYDQAQGLPKLSEVPNGTVFHFRSANDPFWVPSSKYIKLTDTTIWSDRTREIQKIVKADRYRTVQVVERGD